MQGGRCALQSLRLVLLHPGELDRLLAGVQTGAGRRIMGGVIRSSHEERRHLGRPRIQPDQPVADRLAIGIDQPATVALPGHGKRYDTLGEIGHDGGEIAQCLPSVIPSPQHVLLDTSASEFCVGIRARRHPDLHAVDRERHRFENGGAGVEADDEIANHAARAPCASATVV